VQKHRATRLHYDFRLEAGGVLASWAIPKGPSLDTNERRLAMHVEDHPYEYRTFEGVIPAGNYGAGEVIVWDEGSYRLAEGRDPAEEIAKGKIKFIMSGTKLHGMFTLVKIKNSRDQSGEPWLLIKDHDDAVDPAWKIDDHPESVVTGKTLTDIAQQAHPKTWQSDRPAATAKSRARPAVKADPLPSIASPMLCTVVEKPFDDAGWLFELKWDGYRAIATVAADGTVTLSSRTGKDLLRQFSELGDLVHAFRSLPVVVDGEICVLDADGRSSFQALQMHDETNEPVTFVAFDCLYADGRDLRDEPIETRKDHLEALIVPGHRVMYSKHIAASGTELFTFAQEHGLEGIVGKRTGSRYRSTRSRDWIKIKAIRRQEFVIGGWTDPKGSRSGFGALLLGVYDGKELRYAGHVGTGFDGAKLGAISKQLRALASETSPFAGAPPKTNTKAHFVKPSLVAEISFTEWTRDGSLRHPVFVGLRPDKAAKDVVREQPD
jgi:bifunctional non-homologous end joining protein LigD